MNEHASLLSSTPPATPTLGLGFPEFTPAGYSCLAYVGRGNYGKVFLAEDSAGALVALKVVERGHFSDQHAYLRELRGVRNAMQIPCQHEGVIEILDFGDASSPEAFWYTMPPADDFNSGRDIRPPSYKPKTLKAVIRANTRWPLPGCMEICIRLCDAVEHLHNQGLVHRDLKPDNIVYCYGVPKIADLGMVVAAGSNVSFVGTEGYIPTEGPGRPTADVYALGRVFEQILTGRKFGQRQSTTAPETVAPVIQRFLDLACAEFPSTRFASAQTLRAALDEIKSHIALS